MSTVQKRFDGGRSGVATTAGGAWNDALISGETRYQLHSAALRVKCPCCGEMVGTATSREGRAAQWWASQMLAEHYAQGCFGFTLLGEE